MEHLKCRACLSAVALAILASGWAMAGPITINNPGFEEAVTWNVVAPLYGSWSFTVPGWTGGAGPGYPNEAGVFRPLTPQPPAPPAIWTIVPAEGLNVAYSNTLTLSQVLGTALQPNTMYLLEVDVGGRADYIPAGYKVQLLAGGNVLAEAMGVVNQPGWVPVSVSHNSGAVQPGQLLEIRLLHESGVQVDFDDVRLLEGVPEPAGFVLIGTGLIGLAVLSRRPRK